MSKKRYDEMTIDDFNNFNLFNNDWFSNIQLDYLKRNTYYYHDYISCAEDTDYFYKDFLSEDGTVIASVETIGWFSNNPKIYKLDTKRNVNDIETQNIISKHIEDVEKRINRNINVLEEIIDNISVINSDFNYKLKKSITCVNNPIIEEEWPNDDYILFEFNGGSIELYTNVKQLEQKLGGNSHLRGGAHLKKPYYYQGKYYVCVGFYLEDYSLMNLIY